MLFILSNNCLSAGTIGFYRVSKDFCDQEKETTLPSGNIVENSVQEMPALPGQVPANHNQIQFDSSHLCVIFLADQP
ncbi:MAG TPA: hypothetical protein DCM07_31995 [Planctomycetaceae bacterium]|nr:hypothetical protein [Gimesia sp.]HAH49381.1 hypothetical protein [Planctomycetaceae bacterium]HBL42965.1 hypothetical protein [Planctomycetaceae bacterium]|tara:strand:+ start:6524 stop:6754 length:231 start_codon:yes stop_codon:yes gene_type:complete